jgi:ribonuclease I
MEQIKDGGPAFPMAASEYAGHGPCWGMTLHDYFAAKAMAVLMAELENPTTQDVAEWAYRYADAMLAAREGKS